MRLFVSSTYVVIYRFIYFIVIYLKYNYFMLHSTFVWINNERIILKRQIKENNLKKVITVCFGEVKVGTIDIFCIIRTNFSPFAG